MADVNDKTRFLIHAKSIEVSTLNEAQVKPGTTVDMVCTPDCEPNTKDLAAILCGDLENINLIPEKPKKKKRIFFVDGSMWKTLAIGVACALFYGAAGKPCMKTIQIIKKIANAVGEIATIINNLADSLED